MGCSCPVCTSSDPRDRRLRTSAMLETDEGRRILIDCGPDFRQQMLSIPFRPMEAVLLTHEHYDHVGGLDDLRPFSVFGAAEIYADPYCARHLRERIPSSAVFAIYCSKRFTISRQSTTFTSSACFATSLSPLIALALRSFFISIASSSAPGRVFHNP